MTVGELADELMHPAARIIGQARIVGTREPIGGRVARSMQPIEHGASGERPYRLDYLGLRDGVGHQQHRSRRLLVASRHALTAWSHVGKRGFSLSLRAA